MAFRIPDAPVPLQGREDVRRRLVRIEHWRAFVNRPEASKPLIVPARERQHWSPEQVLDYHRARRRYHKTAPRIFTPSMQNALMQAETILENNDESDESAKPGLAIDGPATLGKSTILAQIGKRFELDFRAQFPPVDPRDADLIAPVAYVTLPSKCTPKSFNIRLAEFFHIPLRRSQANVTTEELTQALIDAVVNLHTQVILVDDIHFLNLRDQKNKRVQEANFVVNEHIKALASDLDVTFIFAGINLEACGLFDEGADLDLSGAQTGGRFVRCPVDRFRRDEASWAFVLTELEKRLVLEKYRPGTLLKLGDYLWDRTQGSIGTLTNLVRRAANIAIGKSETLNRKLLAQVKISRNAEASYREILGLEEAA
ncbi:hypothetical protein DAERI_010052 [Deinococcus aerius]|uniref:Uncharacterized protein n=1 Tax=Deinococcus aerius TaxID=200253 RepID=A0A2I9D1I3_9DEIO|nr:ATP-binding protein [Deinococcus aerius]GBF03880.1 hypothetical protein DAERI_010052 [Deinococcus aerius]